MQIIIVLVVAFVFASAIPAHAEGVYFSGQVGTTLLQDSDNKGAGVNIINSYDPGLNVGGALGYQFNPNLRSEFEFLYKQNNLDTLTVNQSNFPSLNGLKVQGNGKARSFNFMLNGFLDLANRSAVTPYLMGGVGGALVSLDNVKSGNTLIVDDSAATLAYQAGAGISVGLSRNVDFTLDYRFFGTSDPGFKDSSGANFDSEVFSHNISAGIRIFLSQKSRVAHVKRSKPKKFKRANKKSPRNEFKKNEAKKLKKKKLKNKTARVLPPPTVSPKTVWKQKNGREDFGEARKRLISLKGNIDTCQNLAEKIELCEPYACEMSHPKLNAYVIHSISGVKDGKCQYEQTMPNNGLMACNFSPWQRKQFSGLKQKFFSSKTFEIETPMEMRASFNMDSEGGTKSQVVKEKKNFLFDDKETEIMLNGAIKNGNCIIDRY
jgi:opacity protein-like surface antigen